MFKVSEQTMHTDYSIHCPEYPFITPRCPHFNHSSIAGLDQIKHYLPAKILHKIDLQS